MSTSLLSLYAVSVIGAFVGWYGCGPIKSTIARCIARASLIAFLCAPGVLVGHGIGISPTLFALVVQPSLFTFGSIAIVWLLVLGSIFAIPPLRLQENRWPPPVQTFFIDGFIGKFLLFGLIYAVILVAALYADDNSYAVQGIRYMLFFMGAAINFALSFHAARSKNANVYATPALFAVPALMAAAPTVSLLWYGGGAAGALVAYRRHRLAAWILVGVFAVLAAVFLERSYLAIETPPHVTIEGGVVGNAAMGALFIVLAAASWWSLTRGESPALDSSDRKRA